MPNFYILPLKAWARYKSFSSLRFRKQPLNLNDVSCKKLLSYCENRNSKNSSFEWDSIVFFLLSKLFCHTNFLIEWAEYFRASIFPIPNYARMNTLFSTVLVIAHYFRWKMYIDPILNHCNIFVKNCIWKLHLCLRFTSFFLAHFYFKHFLKQ